MTYWSSCGMGLSFSVSINTVVRTVACLGRTAFEMTYASTKNVKLYSLTHSFTYVSHFNTDCNGNIYMYITTRTARPIFEHELSTESEDRDISIGAQNSLAQWLRPSHRFQY